MRKNISIFSLLAYLLLACCQSAIANSKVSDDDVYAYLNLSGAQKALSAIPSQLHAMGQQMQLTAKNPAESQKALEQIIASWDQDQIDQIVFDHIKNNINATDMAKLLNWLNTDKIRRIKLAEEQSSDANFEQMFIAYIPTLRETPPSATRIAAVRDFIESTNAVEHTVDMVAGISRGLIENMQVSDEEKPSQQMIDEQIGQLRTVMSAQMEQQLIMVSYFLYRDISDAELTDYADFYKKALGKKDIDLIYGSVGEGLAFWAKNMATKLSSQFADR